MSEKVNLHIQGCVKCLTYQPKHKKEGYLNLFEKHDRPFHTIHVDHLGPLEMSSKKNKYILVVVDGFTKFVKFYATRTTNSQEVMNKMRLYFDTFSLPFRVISDRGTCFTSKSFASFLKELNVKHVLNPTQSPQSNGQVERMNSTLIPMIAKLIDGNTNKWDTVLTKCEFVFNNTINRTIQTTPAKALFGEEQKAENDLLHQFVTARNTEERDFEKQRNDIVTHTKKAQEYNKIQFDKKRIKSHSYDVGEIVLIKNIVTEAGINHKLLPKYRGPYVVTGVLPGERYVVEDLPGQKLTNKPFKGIYAPFNMKSLSSNQGSIELSDMPECGTE